MTRLTANPDLTSSHYTRVSGTGEAGRKATPGLGRMHQPSPKEATMFRMFNTAAILALTLTAAQAGASITVGYKDLDLSRPGDSRVLDSRIRQAAETVCASHFGPSTKLFHERWFENCVRHGVADTRVRIMAQSSGKYRAVASK